MLLQFLLCVYYFNTKLALLSGGPGGASDDGGSIGGASCLLHL